MTAAQVVKLRSAKTLAGPAVRIRVAGKTARVGNARVTAADVKASNGVVHVIDQVLIHPPPSGRAGPPRRRGCASRHGAALACSASSFETTPSSTMRSSTRSRAACAASGWRSSRRRSGDCGSATRSADSASDSRFGSLPK